jgi:hypothetical protein
MNFSGNKPEPYYIVKDNSFDNPTIRMRNETRKADALKQFLTAYEQDFSFYYEFEMAILF